MRIYNSIPTKIKHHVGDANLHYADAFGSVFSLLLRERKYGDLPAMFKYALKVEDK